MMINSVFFWESDPDNSNYGDATSECHIDFIRLQKGDEICCEYGNIPEGIYVVCAVNFEYDGESVAQCVFIRRTGEFRDDSVQAMIDRTEWKYRANIKEK